MFGGRADSAALENILKCQAAPAEGLGLFLYWPADCPAGLYMGRGTFGNELLSEGEKVQVYST